MVPAANERQARELAPLKEKYRPWAKTGVCVFVQSCYCGNVREGNQTHLKGQPMKVPVTMRALEARIRRKLAKDGETLRITRGAKARLGLGYAYIVDNYNRIVNHDFDIAELAREMGCLNEYEEVAE